MLCIANANGDIMAVSPSSVHQGSIDANKILLLAPFAKSATVSVLVTLPNRISLYPQLAENTDPSPYNMAALDLDLGLNNPNGVAMNAWVYSLSAPITQYSGNVTLQFLVTLPDGTSPTTSAVNIPVSRGSAWIAPSVSESDVNTIAAYLAAAQTAAINADADAVAAELWATGTYIDNTDDPPTEHPAEPGDPQYQNNAKYYAGQAESAKTEIEKIKDEIDDTVGKFGGGATGIHADLTPQYVLTIEIFDATGKLLGSSSVDFPLESVVVSGGYDESTKSLILTLVNGNTISIPIDDVIDGLATSAALNTGLAGKVDKLTAALKLYGTDSNGNQTGYSIVDTTGTSKLAVMTQAAVTKALEALDEKIKSNSDDITSIKQTQWFVTPEMFGAVGNGVKDDTEAIQAAIDDGRDIYAPNEKIYKVGTDKTGTVFRITRPISIKGNFLDDRAESVANQNKGLFTVEGVNDFKFSGIIQRETINGTIEDMMQISGPAISFVGNCGNADVNIYCENMRDAVMAGDWSADRPSANGTLGLYDSNINIRCKRVGYAMGGFYVTSSSVNINVEDCHRFIEGCFQGCDIQVFGRNTTGARASLLFHNAILSDGRHVATANNHIEYRDCNTTTKYAAQIFLQFSEVNFGSQGSAPLRYINNDVVLTGARDAAYTSSDAITPIQCIAVNSSTIFECNLTWDISGDFTGSTFRINNRDYGGAALWLNLTNHDRNFGAYIISTNANDKIVLNGSYSNVAIGDLGSDLYVNLDYAPSFFKVGSETIDKVIYFNGNIGNITGSGLNIRYVGSTGNGGGNYLAGNTNKKPDNPQIGTIYYDIQLKSLELWTGDAWVQIRQFA